MCYAMSACVSTSNTLAKRGIEKRKYTKGYHLDLLTRPTSQQNITSLKSLLVNTAAQQRYVQLAAENPDKESQLLKLTPRSIRKLLKQIRNLPDTILCGDELSFRSGAKELVKVIAVGIQEITYKKCENLTGPDYVVKRSSISMIEYSNGHKDVFEEKDAKEEEEEEEEEYYVQEFPDEATAVITKEKDSLAIVSFVLGILSLLLFPYGGFLLAIPGIILGLKARARIRDNDEKLSGAGLARAGIITSIISIGLLLLVISLIVALNLLLI